MHSQAVDYTNAIDQLLGKGGLNFLLSDSEAKVYCNGRELPSSAFTQALQPYLATHSLLCGFHTPEELHSAFEQLLNNTVPLPKIPGIRSVPTSEPEHVHFRGGSYSTTYAYLHQKQWRVVKECEVHNHADKDERLVAEIESIAHLPPKAQKLYPKILEAQKNSQRVRYEMEYIPYHDFAEVVRSGAYDPERLTNLLTSSYDTLFKVLYKPLSTAQKAKNIDYAQTIQTRLAETRSSLPRSADFQIFLNADSLEINGQIYDGVEKTLQKASNFLSDKTIPLTYNHGDLILQDILIDPSTGDFRLIDGNGHSNGYFYDFSKTLLCLETKYDLFYNGDFELVTNLTDSTHPAVNYTFQNDAHLATLEAMRAGFLEYLITHQTKFFTDLKDWEKTLMVLCGLQNIAIVMFHVLHHQKPERACGFLVCGIKLINDTLENTYHE